MKKIINILLVCVMVFSVFSGVYADNTTNNTNNTFIISNKVTNSQNNSVMYVSATGNDGNEGLTPEKSKKTIQNAIDTVSENGTVYVTPGTYHENIKINKKLSLINYNCNLDNTVIVDGDYKDNTMVIGKDGDVDIKHIQLTHGSSAGLINNGKVYFHKFGVGENIVGIVNNGEMTLNHVKVDDNSDKGVVNNGTLTIKCGWIRNNKNDGIFNEGNLNINDATFIEDNGNNGVTTNKPIIIHDLHASRNKNNGVICYGNLTVTDSSFSNNGNNGVICYGNLTVTDAAFLDNGNIGLILTGPSKITHSQIEGNTHQGINNGDILTLTDSKVNSNGKNYNRWEECGINNRGIVHVSNCQFQYNHGLFGGAIYNKGILTITDSIISHNTGRYGAINNQNVLNITNSIIHANRGDDDGDGGSGIQNLGTLNIDKCKITDNKGDWGGGVYSFGLIMNITNSKIQNNKAKNMGGGIYSTCKSTVVVNSTISSNSVSGDGDDHVSQGGGLYIEGDLKVINCKITGNNAREGGGIYHPINSILCTIILNSEITKNIARRGGGIYHTGTLVLNGVKVKDNFAWKGGGIYNINGDIFKDDHTEIKDNWLTNIDKK